MHFRLLALFFCVASLVAMPAAAQSETPAPAYRAGAVLVAFEPGASAASFDALAAAGYRASGEIPEMGVIAVDVPAGEEAAAAERLAQLPGVAYAEPDYWARLQTGPRVIPNDPRFGEQWALPRIGAPEAWAVTTGSASVTIAVIDSGIDLKHPDLKSKLWVNAGEVPFNGKDDDGNGKVDDVNGWHFYQAVNGNKYEARENGQVKDDSGHGTHVSGIAAGAANNAEGIAGISWDSRVMTVKVIDSAIGLAAYSDVAAGILYAADNGASVINLSLGGSAPSQTLCAAVAEAVNRGKIVVAAAGNKDNTVYYPAACPGALAVGATDEDDNPASFSNPGARVDMAAPGVDILSAWYKSGLNLSTYDTLSGTSQAAPHVAGAAALVWARWPALTADGVIAQLQGTLVDVGLPGRDDETGWGRLDIGRALAEQVERVDLRLAAQSEPAKVIAGNPLTATFTISNRGDHPATSVTLSAALPAEPVFDGVRVAASDCSLKGSQMRCGLARLDPGASVDVTVVMTPTTVGDGILTTTASVNAAQRELTPGDNRIALATEIRPVLWGRVFLDWNGDGERQPWETRGVPNTWVLLEQGGQSVAYTAAQVPGGRFQFDMLPSGEYSVVAELPSDYQFTTPGEVAISVAADREQSVLIGAWTGAVQPVPGRAYLPVTVGGR